MVQKANPYDKIRMNPNELANSSNPLHAMAALMNALPWRPVDPPENTKEGDKYATHYAELTVGEFKFRCFQLNDGTQVMDQSDVERFMAAHPPQGRN